MTVRHDAQRRVRQRPLRTYRAIPHTDTTHVFPLLAAIGSATTTRAAAQTAADGLLDLLQAQAVVVVVGEDQYTPVIAAATSSSVPRNILVQHLRSPLAVHYDSTNGGQVLRPIQLAGRTHGHVAIQAPDRCWRRTETAMIDAVANQLGQALERAHLLEATERWINELAAVYDTAVAISAQLDLPTTLQAIVEQATRLVHADGGGLYLCDTAMNELEVVVSYHLDRDYCGARIKYGEGLAGQAAVSQQIEFVNDYSAWHDRAHQYESAPFQAVLAVPLLLDGHVLGVIDLMHLQAGNVFHDADIAVVKRLAVQAVMAITNARPYDDAYYYASRMTKLARASQLLDVGGDLAASLQPLAKASVEVLDAQACLIMFTNALHVQTYHSVGCTDLQTEQLRLPLAAVEACSDSSLDVTLIRDTQQHALLPALADSARSRAIEPLATTASALGFRSVIMLPLLRNDRQIGTATYLYTDPHAWREDEVEVARIVANQMAALIANVQLYGEVHEANRLKAEFVSTMSHELRTPMGAIIGYTELLTNGSYGDVPTTMREPLARVQANANHLLTLINQMLDLSRIEARRLDLHEAPYSPHDLLHSVSAMMQPLALAQSLCLSVQIKNGVPPIVLGDVGRMRQILINLAGNSIKFTQAGSIDMRCTIVGAGSGSQLVFEVIDTGIGIPDDQLALIWEPFRQGDSSATREYNGTGLGLAIVRKLVELMGGSVAVESTLGRGSTFSVHLPLLLPTYPAGHT